MGGQHPRVTEADEAKVRELHAQGLGRNQIAQEIGRGPRTVSRIAERLGLQFDRTATAVATEARKADAAARRVAIAEGLYAVAQDELDYLRRPGPYSLVEVSAGKAVRYEVERLPAQDRRALMNNASTGVTTAAKLEALEADPAAEQGRSMLLSLADGIRRLAGAPEDDDGEG
ncbi:helix-turn-helix domain-containing protein [Streptomyces sp. NPDC013740]|uniref:helix-turn-helix domain-containing protein n=1 Tax=Streptomyces sp. NPDC013740 TaxID=3364867 RepID=UPI003701D149